MRILLLLALFPMGCAVIPMRPAKIPYPDHFRARSVEVCTAKGGSPAMCNCVVDKVQEGYPDYRDYKLMQEEFLLNGEKMSPEYEAMIRPCIAIDLER